MNANSSALASYNSSASCSRWYCSRCHAPLYADEAGRPDLPLFVCAGVLDETALAKLPFEDMYTENCATWFSRGEKLVAHRAGYFDRET